MDRKKSNTILSNIYYKKEMALESKRITKKEFQTYYEPLRSDFERMVNSVNSSMGFGQIIQKYIGTEVLNTYYHVWDNNLNQQVVLDKTTGGYYPPEQAGPMLWETSASNGLGFLNGLISLSGYRKFKYCVSCSDRNTPAFQSVDNFKKRYDQVGSLLSTHNTLDAYLFYDFALTRFNNVFPAVKYDDGVNVTFYFKDINGTDKSLNEIAQTTNKPVSEIETSINDAEIVKPQIGTNTVITSCCDESLSYVISGQYNVGATLYTVGMTESYCWYAESLTDQAPTAPETVTFTNGGRSCAECVRLNPCPSPCEEMSLGYTEGRTSPISDACSASQLIYEYDSNEGVLYQQGQCGISKAEIGYYSDGRTIYFVGGDGKLNEVETCQPPPPSYFEFVDIFSDNFNEIWSYTNSALQQSWSDVNNFRFMYDTTYVQLSIRIISTYEPPTQGSVFNTPPKENGLSYIDPSNIYGINLGYYLTIGCDINFYPTETTTIPVDVQGNFGDKFNPDWRTIGTFNATIIIPA